MSSGTQRYPARIPSKKVTWCILIKEFGAPRDEEDDRNALHNMEKRRNSGRSFNELGLTFSGVYNVQGTPVKRLCKSHNIITVNGQFPGPNIEVRNGDTLIITVSNRTPYNVTIHWHGIRQIRTAWADGPEFVTQCPVKPGGIYTYRFTIKDQEGTLWWHAHSSWLRATVYGALIIHPKEKKNYPFLPPKREYPILLGEWWDQNPIDVIHEAISTGSAPSISDAFTINGQPGDLYNCSSKEITIFPVNPGETILLRFINAALNTELFVSIAGHSMMVVAADASYVKPFLTSVIMLAPGQTTDVLITTSLPPSRYYIAARAYSSAESLPFDNTTATAILDYDCGCLPGPTQPPPAQPILPLSTTPSRSPPSPPPSRAPHPSSSQAPSTSTSSSRVCGPLLAFSLAASIRLHFASGVWFFFSKLVVACVVALMGANVEPSRCLLGLFGVVLGNGVSQLLLMDDLFCVFSC
ncbi:hypothetical protein KFK09_016842 [Dendrobium nobile]|uniref:laccase n=1 Tax=Dendrobium nobile TaxID=94219 RepID=A0A8T3B0I8_DENNO|nr:hypothetical protein KFK09_016842 [Dendrobium nobile]